MKAIFERRSIRKYTGEKVSEELVGKLLKAAMAAPSAGNQQVWEFIVVRDRKVLEDITKAHQYSQMLKEADLAIIVCADTSREKYKGYWVQDCSAATENILVEAQHLGLGAVWLGVYPVEQRVKDIKKLFKLPEDVYPLSIISIGHPGERKEHSDRFDKNKIHYDRW
ncbi:nitroreductase family protein [uncultured Clostridium sp.]|uniref:nitroreductase family protein n=1 Tax=uncultured Clostridium sp. TaxID=59620 RepID=UPI0028E18E9F|nr:nitroreductase family protein [uncultured Clostridium sp.]